MFPNTNIVYMYPSTIQAPISYCLYVPKYIIDDLQSVSDQLTEGGKNNVEIEKIQRKLAADNEELQIALEEAEV